MLRLLVFHYYYLLLRLMSESFHIDEDQIIIISYIHYYENYSSTERNCPAAIEKVSLFLSSAHGLNLHTVKIL